MKTSEIITLAIATSAFLTSAVSAFEAYRQNKNSIRPVLVVIEKLTDNRKPSLGFSLFLVNMGHSLAMNVVVSKSNLVSLLSTKEILPQIRTEIAVSRRGLLASGYKKPILDKVKLLAVYTDINNRIYNTELVSLQHSFSKGNIYKR